ncbi:uncharacterized protein LOC131936015 [Physella acuta]|uniref:uncharacterized protein LOC131936015 n=1 Tax=Physella acuta TaxID=109671 RepID=UPI0027DC0D07|nr:uncharacterized protein LOC131936015 [Physella acuta]
MDVTQGLIVKLVKCKSIERAIAPIASQVSLLVILAEEKEEKQAIRSDHGTTDSNLSLIHCASRIMAEAVKKFINEGEKLCQKSQNQDFIHKVKSANENLTVTTDQLLIVVHRLESGTAPDNIIQILCQTAKDVLQGVLRVLLVIDDFHVQELIQKVDLVISHLQGVNLVEDYAMIKKRLAQLAVTVMTLRGMLCSRCRNLCSKLCSDQLTVWGNVLQSSLPVLHKVTKTCCQYPGNVSAKASFDSVQQEIKQACQKIKQLLCFGPQDTVDDMIISFVGVVDKLMDLLSETNRRELHEDVESEIVTLVQHSLSVAHYSTGLYREMIVASCHRILQLKARLVELNIALKNVAVQRTVRIDFSSVCETILDEICDLEKHVNMTLLTLIVDTFLCPKDELMKLKKIAYIQNTEAQLSGSHLKLIKKFTEFTENLCQVAMLVASSSTDNSKVRDILTAVKGLELIDPEIAPAVMMNSRDPKNRASNKHLDLILSRWEQEVTSITGAIDSIVDPKVFMDLTESVYVTEIENFTKMMVDPSHKKLLSHSSRVRNLVKRPILIAEKLVDESSDPIYRNGLRCFINKLCGSLSEADAVYIELLQTKDPTPKQQDTVERRLKIVLQDLKSLREGLDVKKHPHILSHKRLLFKQRSGHSEGKLKTLGTATVVKDRTKEDFEARMKELMKAKEMPVIGGMNKDDKNKREEERQSKKLPSDFSNLHIQEQPTKSSKPTAENMFDFPQIFKEKELEGGAVAEIYGLVKKLLTKCAAREGKAVEDLTHSLLSWTNHVIENSETLVAHCSHVIKKSELIDLVHEVDKLATEVIQMVKFATLGETTATQELLARAMSWAHSVNRARLIIDVTCNKWLTMTSSLPKLIEERNDSELKQQMKALMSVQMEVCQLLEKAFLLSAKHLEKGNEKMEFITASRNEIENLSITIKTTVDVTAISDERAVNDWWQLSVACRDWSVLMTCIMSEFEDIAREMEETGLKKLQCLHGLTKDRTRTADVFDKETNCLLELVDCVVIGDTTLKARSEQLVTDLKIALSDVLTVAKQPVSLSDSIHTSHFSKASFEMAKSRWIEKALDTQDMVCHNCYEYMGFVHQLLTDTQNIISDDDLKEELKLQYRHMLTNVLVETSNDLKQKALKAIQTCPDLTKRAVIRSTLDTVSKLTSEVERVIRVSNEITEADVNTLSVLWAARVKKLVLHLRKMDGVRASIITEIENLNKQSGAAVMQGPYVSPVQHQHASVREEQNVQQHPHNGQQPVNLQASQLFPHYLQDGSTVLPQPGNYVQPGNYTQSGHIIHPGNFSKSGNIVHPDNFTQSGNIVHPGNFTQPAINNHGQQLLPHQSQTLNYPQFQPTHNQQPQFLPHPQYSSTGTSQTAQNQPPAITLTQPSQHTPSHQNIQPHQPQLYNSPPALTQSTQQSPTHQNIQPQLYNSPPTLTPSLPPQQTPTHQNIQTHQHSPPNQGASASFKETPTRTLSDSVLSPNGKSVNSLLKDAQFLGVKLNKWQDKMADIEGQGRSKVVQDALEMARLCSEMAMFTKGQGPLKNSEEVIAAAVAIVRHSQDIETFANRLLSLAGKNRLSDNLNLCILKMNGCSSQLQIIASALHNSPKSHQVTNTFHIHC